jgi:hypothetical protein
MTYGFSNVIAKSRKENSVSFAGDKMNWDLGQNN